MEEEKAMRTYRIEKRFGVSGSRNMFSDTKTEESKRFDFIEFLLPDEKATITAPESFAKFISSMKRRDGSYADAGSDILGIYSTCRAVCAMKTMGLEVEKETIEYLERMKNDGDGSFRSEPGSGEQGTIESTYWATLALRLCGKPVPQDSIDYVRGFRKGDGSYGTLVHTNIALTVLRAAGCALSTEEKSETVRYIVSAFWESEFDDITDCYHAVVSLNLLGAEPEPAVRAAVTNRIEEFEPESENENFKVSVIRRCVGSAHGKMRTLAGKVPESMSETYAALLAMKLGAYGR